MNLYESVKSSLNERDAERAWSSDGRSLNIREMVARVLEDNKIEKTDEEIDLLFDKLLDTPEFDEGLTNLIEKIILAD